MSESQKKEASVYRRLMQPAALNYLVLTAAGLGIYLLVMLGKANTIGAVIVLAFAALGRVLFGSNEFLSVD